MKVHVLFTCVPSTAGVFVEIHLLSAVELSYGKVSWKSDLFQSVASWANLPWFTREYLLSHKSCNVVPQGFVYKIFLS